MIGYDDPWIAPCGKAFFGPFGMACHEVQCSQCLEILKRDFDKRLPPEDSDADDRGICYEDD